MATGCSNKEFETRYDKEMYYDQEYESFCANFEFAVGLFVSISIDFIFSSVILYYLST